MERFNELQNRLNESAQRISNRKKLKVEIHNYLEWNTNKEMCEVIMDYCNGNNTSLEVVEDIICNSPRLVSIEEYPYWRLK